jgi:hypothetical protein
MVIEQNESRSFDTNGAYYISCESITDEGQLLLPSIRSSNLMVLQSHQSRIYETNWRICRRKASSIYKKDSFEM